MPRHLANFPLVSRPYINVNTPTDSQGDARVSARTTVIDLKPWNGTSTIRETITLTAAGTVTQNSSSGEIVLNTAASATSAAVISTRDYVNTDGSGFEVSIGIRLSSATFSGTQFARWGLSDGTNGVYYQVDSNGLSIVQLRSGVTTSIPRASWNIDELDGTGPSAYTLDVTRPNIYRMNYSLGGYGAMTFSVIATDTSDITQIILPIHAILPSTTTVSTPCLPLRVELSNGATTATANTLNLGLRLTQILGVPNPMVRFSQAVRDTTVSVSNAAFTIVLGIRKRTGVPSVRCVMRLFEAVSTNRWGVWQILLNPTITGGTWTTPTYQTAAHTALETNVAPTGFSGGTVIYSGVFDNGVVTRVSFDAVDDISLTTNDTWGIIVRSVVGNSTMNLTSVNFSEYW